MADIFLTLIRKHRQFLLYCIIGASGALLDLIVFLILFNGLHVNAIVATVISTSLGIINNFFLNARFNFKVKNNLRMRLLNFYAVGISGLILSIIIIFVAHNGLGIDANIAKMISIPVIVIAQFILNKKLSFGKSPLGPKTSRRQLIIIGGLVLLYGLYMWNATYLAFQDEIDNILGGWLISHHGQVLFVDFFSHHMPLPYFISAFITLFTGNDLDLFRYVFTTGLFVWLIFIIRKFYQHTNLTYASILAVLLTLVHIGALAHLMLAETLIAYAALHAALILIYDFFGSKQPVTLQKVILISILGFIPVLSSVSYLTLSLLIYVMFAVYYVFYQKLLTKNRSLLVARDIVILAVPYILFVIYLLITRSYNEFIHDAYKFNVLYYSQFTTSAGESIGSAYLSQLTTVINSIAQAFYITTPHLTLVNTLAFLLVCISVLILILERKYISAFIIAAIVYISGTRGGIAIDVYTEGTKRGQVYVFIVCLIAVFVLKWAIEQNRKRKISDSLRGLTLLALVLSIATIGLHGISSLHYNSNVWQLSDKGVQTDVSTPEEGGDVARIINGTTESGDTYWLGPWDFSTQLFVERERSSRYTFFLPWHSVCPECYDELLTSFDEEKPTVVYWKHGTDMLGKDVDSYNDRLFKYLNEKYFKASDPELSDYYFLKSKESVIKPRLDSLGFKE